MEAETDFNQLMQRVRAGCPRAAREVYDRYSGHIRRVVRRQLHQRLRTQFDSTDFLQSVWASFFREGPARYAFEGPEALVSFLCQVALNKVVEAFRRQLLADRRSLNRECTLGGVQESGDGNPRTGYRQPTPSEVAIARERFEQLAAGQPQRGQAILAMLREGHTHAEIADRLRLHPKVIQRFLRKLSGAGDTS